MNVSLNNILTVQTLSPQPTINSLSIPQKPKALKAIADPLARTEIGTTNNAALRAKTESPPIRRLPDEVKKVFETASRNFADYASDKKYGEKKGAAVSEKPLVAMDEWDRALLLGEYPLAAVEKQKPKRLSFAPTTNSLVPQKTDMRRSGTAFPSRVMDEGIVSPVRRVTMPVVPQKPKNI